MVFNDYCSYNNRIIIIDIKFLEIIQIIEREEKIETAIFKKNYLIEFQFLYNRVEIITRKFNKKDNNFSNPDISIGRRMSSFSPKVIITDNDYVVFCDNNIISFYIININ